MTREIKIRQAMPGDGEIVSEILKEAARWLEQAGMPMWREEELALGRIVPDVDAGFSLLRRARATLPAQ